MKLKIECYSGRKADERPVRFQLGEHEYNIQELLDQWYGPHDVFFKVKADDGNVYILRSRTFGDKTEWYLESYRQTRT